MSSLPVELWEEVITHLARVDCCSCLSVCRTFHDIALRRTFSSITLYFNVILLLDTLRPRFVLEKNDEAVEYDEKLYDTTLDILVRMAEDAHFASVVKSITVVRKPGYLQEFREGTMTSLLDALANAHQLQSFRWYGDWPDVKEADDLLNELATLCPQFQSLRLPRSAAVLIRSPTRTMKLGQFKGLRSVAWYDLVEISRPYEENDPDNVDIWEVVHNSKSSLASISVEAMLLKDDLPGLSHITSLHLESLFHSLLPRVGIVLRQVPFLRSLSLRAAGNDEPDGIFALLQDHAALLPKLDSLRISSEWSVNGTRSAPLIDALRKWTSLRCLDLDFFFCEDPTTILPSFLHKKSPIQCLGLKLDNLQNEPYMTWTYEQCQRLCGCLPNGLSALRLTSSFDRAESHTIPLLDRLGQLSNLRFLYIGNDMGYHPFLAVDLAADYPSLITVGVNDRIWDVSRVDGVSYLYHWPDPLIVIRPKEMFASDDDHWLMSQWWISPYSTS
ncbi:hypothetical protein OE88DRAFT_1809005 [Heliocybe sulcata]|uniref:F-box domain-containing protein n=1 Tax=Heliocybe sulcata TaxID=5364 RepID=A0A5C3MYL0_9AGAM|nr:hypothetical protein OE88DRAFT_1809005 [Heliocybe sulcata]